MSAALFTMMGQHQTLVNLAQVTHIEKSLTSPGNVLVHFDNGKYLTIDGTIESVLMKIGGGRSEQEKADRPRPGDGNPRR